MEEMPIEIEKLPVEEVIVANENKEQIEPPEENPPETKTVRYITEKQGKRLFAIMNNLSVPAEIVKSYLKEKYNIEHSKNITMDIYEAVVNWVEDYGAKNQPPKE